MYYSVQVSAAEITDSMREMFFIDLNEQLKKKFKCTVYKIKQPTSDILSLSLSAPDDCTKDMLSSFFNEFISNSKEIMVYSIDDLEEPKSYELNNNRESSFAYLDEITLGKIISISICFDADFILSNDEHGLLTDVVSGRVKAFVAKSQINIYEISKSFTDYRALITNYDTAEITSLIDTLYSLLSDYKLPEEEREKTVKLEEIDLDTFTSYAEKNIRNYKNQGEAVISALKLPIRVDTEETKKKTISTPIDDDETATAAPKGKTQSKTIIINEETKTVLNKINELIGADEFKAFANQLTSVSLSGNCEALKEAFPSTCYLFSINDGCGLSTVCKLFKDLVEALELCVFSDYESDYYEQALPLDIVTDSGQYCNTAKEDDSMGTVTVYDVSTQMDKPQNLAFKAMLKEISHKTRNNVFIFRVPFVEDGVINKMAYAINDIMNVKVIKFAPYSNDDYIQFAEKTLQKVGFRLAKAAREPLIMKLTEEKNDGKFYGLSTCSKVVSSLLTDKLFLNSNKPNFKKVIEKKDVEKSLQTAVSDLSGIEKLKQLIGHEGWLKQVEQIIAQIKTIAEDRMNGGTAEKPALHMQFVGAPGTGKTTVARIIGQIFKEANILSIGHFYEVTRRDLIAQYIGQTAPKVADVCRNAYGSILFIDEAYALTVSDEKDFAKEAVETLISEMENHRHDLIVIFAGYDKEMAGFMQSNPGLASRVPYKLYFPNYTKEQLFKIFESMTHDVRISNEALAEVRKFIDSILPQRLAENSFANGRMIRNLYEKIWAKAALRHYFDKSKKPFDLEREDVLLAINEEEFKSLNTGIDSNGGAGGKIGF